MTGVQTCALPIYMGKIMARKFKRVILVAGRDESQFGIALEWTIDVAQFAIDAGGNGCLRKSRPDRGRYVGRRGTGLHFTDRTVGQANLEKFRQRLVLGLFAVNCRAHGTRRRSLEAAFAKNSDFGKKRQPPETGRWWIAQAATDHPRLPGVVVVVVVMRMGVMPLR